MDSLTNVWLPLFYEFSNDWRILYWLNLAFTFFLALPFLLFVQESPKYLVSLKKFRQARNTYSFIAKINKKRMFLNRLEGEGSD